MITYQIIKDATGKECGVYRSDGWSIPFDPDNVDFQQYQKWLSEGNQPLPADEVKA